MDETRIKIWYLIGNLEIGGAERTIVDLANGLNSDQFDITIWTIENSNPLAQDLHDSVELRSLGAVGKFDFRAPVKLLREVHAETPDILQSFLFYDNILAVLAGVFIKDMSVITGVRAVPNEPAGIRHYIRLFIHPRADYVVSNSKAGAEYIRGYGVDPSKVTVIHNGRDLASYASGNATEELYEELGLSREQPVVGTVGRLIKRKGHFDLIDAWPKVLDSYPDGQLLIVGDGPVKTELREMVSTLGCTDSIHLSGQRDDIPDILDLLDVFVFPSHFEGLPGALLEAMAAGLPIVTTPVDGNKELIKDSEQGIHIPSHSPTALADAIIALLKDEDQAIMMGKQAKEHAFSQFTLGQMISEFEDLYEEVT